MKILYVINSFQDGGAELGLLTLVENGFFTGHDVIVLALARDVGTVRQRLIDISGVKGERGAGIEVRWLFEASKLRDTHLPLGMLRLVKVLKQEQPDVLVLSLPQANLIGRIASLAVPETKVVSFEHSAAFRRGLTASLMRLTAPLVDAIFYDHAETWKSVRSLYPNIPDKSAYYVPLTVLSPACSLRPTDIEGRCLIAGRLTEEKNHVELIHAIRIAADRGYTLDLTIAGDGSMRPILEQLVLELGLSNRVRFTGFVQDLSHLRASCDVYIQSSRFEGLCLSVLEAMAAGMLVVATDVGAIRQYGSDGLNMIKLSGIDRHSIATGLIRAVSLPSDQVGSIRDGALRTIHEHFTGPRVSSHWGSALRALLPGLNDLEQRYTHQDGF
jgi:glycosyltransferase involved in cell wall biosynthesis